MNVRRALRENERLTCFCASVRDSTAVLSELGTHRGVKTMSVQDPKTKAAPLSTAAIAALQRGNKIEAIKMLRAERNIGLKEAKDAVDDYVSSQPSLLASLASAQNDARRTALLWLAVLAGLAFLAYYFLIKP